GNWPRTSPDGKPALYMTRDGGASWQRQDHGLPREQAWWTVKRQALCGDARNPVGLYLGTTNGEVWASDDEGASFRLLFRDLPHIFSVTIGETAWPACSSLRSYAVTRPARARSMRPAPRSTPCWSISIASFRACASA